MQATVWYASTLGASAEERISGDLSKIKLLRWEADSFAELAAEKLKVGLGPRAHAPTQQGVEYFKAKPLELATLPYAHQPIVKPHAVPLTPLQGYEREHKELSLLLFPEVLERIARFDRVLSQPGGSLLLCGNSGVGRRSLVLLTAYMHNMEFMTPKMTK